MHCKYIKLANGDNLLITLESDCEDYLNQRYLEFIDPVQIGFMRFPRDGKIIETFILQPWMKMSVTNRFKIPVNNIIVLADLHDSAIEQYKEYLNENSSALSYLENDEEEFSEENNFSEEKIESFLNMFANTENLEDDEDDYGTRDSKTIH